MMNNGKKIILSVALVLCLALLVTAAFLITDMIYAPQGEAGDGAGNHGDAITVDGEEYWPKSGVKNYLIMGVDQYGAAAGSGIGQVDFLMVLSFDSTTKTYTMIPINRDTMVEVNEYDGFGGDRVVTKQIALSHSYVDAEGVTNKEKCINTAKAASRILLGMEFDGYMSMTMNAVCEIVDHLGGVEILVEEDLTDIDPSFKKGETVTLNGELAIKFVRARGGLEDSTNTARMNRHRAFLTAFFAKLGSDKLGEASLVQLYDKVRPYVCNNAGDSGYESLFNKLIDYEMGETISISGEQRIGKGGYVEFYVDEESVKEVVTNVFYKKAKK